MNGYLDGTSAVTVRNVPFPVYNVVVYFNGDSPTQGRVSQYQVGSTSIFAQDTAAFTGPYTRVPATSTADLSTNTPTGNFAVFSGLSGSSFTLNAIPGSSLGTQRSVVNAIEIVPTQNAIALATDGPLLAVNRSFNATVTLPQPVPANSSVSVSLAANPSGVVGISPATQTILAGQTTAVFTLTAGATAGSVVLTATATGYNNAIAPLAVTSNVISFGTIPNLAPGQSGSLPVSLSFPAPAKGLTINFSSANTSVATVTPSVFVPAGLVVPAANPQVTGVAIGTTQVTATAVGFAPDTGTVAVTVTATLNPTSISVNATRTATATLT